MRKPTRTSLTNKIDRLVSEITRSIGHCVWCGDGDYEKLQCAHIYSRKFKSVRFDLRNVLCLCARCHFHGHSNPVDFIEFVKRYLGDYEYEQLRLRATPTSHHKLNDLQDIYNSLIKTKEGTC